MMLSSNNQLLIAAAGAGKTYELVITALAERTKKIIISTFTINNTDEIRQIFYKKNNCIPGHVTIRPWFTLLLEHFVRPFQGVLCQKRVAGVNLVNSQSGLKCNNNNHPIYWPEGDIDKYYFDKNHRIYSDKISKFAFRCNQKTGGAVIKRFNSIFDCVYIDEAQDLAGYDLEIIKLLLKSNLHVKLVGDPRQVAYSTHDESKHKKYYGPNFADFFRQQCNTNLIDVRDDLLITSRRCVLQICNFADRLYPTFHPTGSVNTNITGHDGVFFIKSQDVAAYLNEYQPMQLRWDRKVIVNSSRPAMNFGDSKGKSFDRVLIYPTVGMVNWLENNSHPLKPVTKSKFYIAITRARQSVGIVINKETQKNISGKFWKPTMSSAVKIGDTEEICNTTRGQLGLWPDL